MNFLSGMPDFVFDYIEIAYNGESINTNRLQYRYKNIFGISAKIQFQLYRKN